MPPSPEPTYALQLVRPFWSLLSRYPQLPPDMLPPTESVPDDLRVPVAQGQAYLQQVVDLTGEVDLGLLAAQETKVGTFDVVEFVAFSASTRRAGIEALFRYIRLMNEAAAFYIDVIEDKAHLVLHSTVPLVRAGIDFQSAATHLTATRWYGESPADLEVLFTYPEPEDTTQHRRTFGETAKLRFGAPWNGFIHGAGVLDKPLTSSDASVHRMLREHAERLLAELAPDASLGAEVRGQLLESLKEGPPSAETLATSMGITRRTLSRRLRQENTSFTQLLDDVRRQAAIRYLDTTDHSIDDIAFLVGFSESSAFVRAFKRWQGLAPAAYRRSRRQT